MLFNHEVRFFQEAEDSGFLWIDVPDDFLNPTFSAVSSRENTMSDEREIADEKQNIYPDRGKADFLPGFRKILEPNAYQWCGEARIIWAVGNRFGGGGAIYNPPPLTAGDVAYNLGRDRVTLRFNEGIRNQTPIWPDSGGANPLRLLSEKMPRLVGMAFSSQDIFGNNPISWLSETAFPYKLRVKLTDPNNSDLWVRCTYNAVGFNLARSIERSLAAEERGRQANDISKARRYVEGDSGPTALVNYGTYYSSSVSNADHPFPYSMKYRSLFGSRAIGQKAGWITVIFNRSGSATVESPPNLPVPPIETSALFQSSGLLETNGRSLTGWLLTMDKPDHPETRQDFRSFADVLSFGDEAEGRYNQAGGIVAVPDRTIILRVRFDERIKLYERLPLMAEFEGNVYKVIGVEERERYRYMRVMASLRQARERVPFPTPGFIVQRDG